MSWYDVTVKVKGVDYKDALEAVRHGRHITVWDDLTWRYWQETGLDHRTGEELDEQPDGVEAHSIGRKGLRSMGLFPCDDAAVHVVFICHEARWAVVASAAPLIELEEECEDDEEDNN